MEMYDYILESKAAVRNIVSNQQAIFADSLALVQNKTYHQIYLVGSGTSYNASLAAAGLMQEVLKTRVTPVFAMEFVDNEQIFDRNALVIGISHAGHSTSTIMALEKARETGLDTIAVSGVSDARVFDHSDARILLDIGPELVGPKTKGFIGSIATLQLFAMKSAEIRGLLSPAETANWTARMVAVTDQIPDIAKQSADWYQQQKTELLPCRRLIVLGYGNVMGAMREGALKLLEACRYSVVGYEMEEFMHGVYHSIDSNTYLLYLGPQGKHYERMKNMARYFAEERKAHNYLITADRSVENGNNFIFPFKDDPYFESMEYVVPCQVLARKMSLDLGIDCNISSDPDFHRKMGSYTY